MMESRQVTLLIGIVVFALCQAAQEVNLGSSSTACGTNMVLDKGEMYNVFSKGGAPNGFCSVLLHSTDTDTDCPYKAFCVTVTMNMMSTCAAKVFLTGTSYDIKGVNSKEVSCYSSTYGEWCTQSKSLEISVFEDPKSTSSYGFNMTVGSKCRSKPSGEFQPKTSNNRKIDEIEEQIVQNRIVGVVVGVCLACMFLIVLFISFNYYKNKPTYRQQRDT